MTKKRKPATRSKPKTKSKSRKASARKAKAKLIPVVVQKVDLPPAGIVRAVVPPGVMPAVIHDPIKGVVDILALPKKKKAWWDFS